MFYRLLAPVGVNLAEVVILCPLLA
jgi:hypothetical protein